MHDDQRLVTVLTTGDGGQIALASSILEEAGIPYFEKGGISRRLGIYLFNLMIPCSLATGPR
jgi:hypothetical protein